MPPMCNREPPLFAIEWKGKLGGKKKNAAANAEQLHVYVPHCPEQNSSFYFGEKAIALLPGYSGCAHIMFTHRLWQVYPEQLFEAAALPTSTGPVTLLSRGATAYNATLAFQDARQKGRLLTYFIFCIAFPTAEGWNNSKLGFPEVPLCQASITVCSIP